MQSFQKHETTRNTMLVGPQKILNIIGTLDAHSGDAK